MAAFRPEALVDKLNKLNASQQSIETISQWCIFFRKVGSSKHPLSELLLASSIK